MSSPLLPAPAFSLCFLISNQRVLAEPGLTGETAGSFSSSYALGLIQAERITVHYAPSSSTPCEEAPVYIRFGTGGIIATEVAKKELPVSSGGVKGYQNL